MSWRRIAAYYFTAAVVGGLLWSEWQGRQAELISAAPAAETPMLELGRATVQFVSVRTGALEIRLERAAGGWKVLAPAGTTVAGDLVEAILDTLSSIPPIETVAGTSDASAEYGLKPARVTLALADSSGQGVVVELGKRNPTGTAVYARTKGRPEVRLLGLNASYYVDLMLEDLRGQLAVTAPG